MTTFEIESMTLPTAVLKKSMQGVHVIRGMKSVPADVFIETGSYDGRTIEQALSCGYAEVHSIELNVEYHAICKKRFASDPRVHLYLGDTEEVLPEVLKHINFPATFWLDAHIQEGTVGKHAAPLLQELVAIRGHRIKNHVLMIDDMRLLGQGWWQDINIEAVKGIINTINPLYEFEFVDSKAALRDILIARVNL